MPFGLANAPATFQRFIQHVLQEYLEVFCFVYIDDILIFSKTRHENISHIKKILLKLREFLPKASLKKCQFFQTEVTFLGFDITQQGIEMNKRKLDTINDWPFPISIKELQRFLGFTNFYQRFIPNFSRAAQPMTKLTKTTTSTCLSLSDPKVKELFSYLKSLFIKELLLRHFDFD
jgi:hypothetical protein